MMTFMQKPIMKRRAPWPKMFSQLIAGDLGVADDRAGDQLAEHGLVGGVVEQAAAHRNVAAPDIDQVADRLQHVERQARGEHDVGPACRVAAELGCHLVERGDTEIGVFEPGQHRQIGGQARDQQPGAGARAGAGGLHQPADGVGAQGDADQQSQEIHSPPSIEGPGKQQDGPVPPADWGQVVAGEEQRQEQAQEFERGEDHRRAVPADAAFVLTSGPAPRCFATATLPFYVTHWTQLEAA
jgi:hypothetical protein